MMFGINNNDSGGLSSAYAQVPPQQRPGVAPINENHFLDMLFGSACRKQCIKKLGGKGEGLKDCIRDCKGKGVTKSKARDIELAQQEKLSQILSESVTEKESGTNPLVWVLVVVVMLALFGSVFYFMRQQKQVAAA